MFYWDIFVEACMIFMSCVLYAMCILFYINYIACGGFFMLESKKDRIQIIQNKKTKIKIQGKCNQSLFNQAFNLSTAQPPLIKHNKFTTGLSWCEKPTAKTTKAKYGWSL